MAKNVHDIIGIGFGPGNLALAIALEEKGFSGRILFLERQDATRWHPDMLIDGSDIQNHPLRDLVTPRNPRSRYGFVNYLHETGQLFEYLNVPLHYPLRKEYGAYVNWVAQHFNHWVRYNTSVEDVEIVETADGPLYRITADDGVTYLSRSLVVGTGRTPNIPQVFKPHIGGRVFHFTRYLDRLAALDSQGPPRSIAVVGGSQTAVELMLDLADRYPRANIANLIRSFSIRLKDTSPFSERVFFPEFIETYYHASPERKAALDRELRPTNYSTADKDVIEKLYVRMYEERLDGRNRLEMINCTVIDSVEDNGDSVSLTLRDLNSGTVQRRDFDAVILATGFLNLGVGDGHEKVVPLISRIADRFEFNEQGYLRVTRDYALVPAEGDRSVPPIYLNGLCESTHGLGDSGSFSLLSLRGASLADSLLDALPDRRGDDAGPVVMPIRADARPWQPDGSGQYIALTPETAQNKQEGVILSRLEPGGATSRHTHQQAEGVLILAGRCELEVGDKVVTLGARDICHIGALQHHTIRNPSASDALEYVTFWWSGELNRGDATLKAASA